MTGRVHILNSDELDRELLAEAFGRTGISDYVERGLIPDESDVDFANAVVDIPVGKCYILDNGRDSMLLADARAGVSLATDGTNHVYISYDLSQPEGERIGYHVDSDQTPPADPSLRIAAIDMAAENVVPINDTAPIYRRDAETYKGNDIDTDGDGVVDVATTANSVDGADVDGAVSVAETATSADNADGLGANGVVTAQSALDLDYHALRKIGQAKVRKDGAPSLGLNIRTETTGGINYSRIIPVHPTGGERSDDALAYDYNTSEWSTGVPLRAGAVKARKNTAPELGLDIFTDTSDGENRTHFVPTHPDESTRRFGDDLHYRFGGRDWRFSVPVFVEGSAVLTNGDESGLDVDTANTADTANSLSTAAEARRVIDSPNVHFQLTTLESGETTQIGPLDTGGNTFALWSWGVSTADGSTLANLVLRLTDGGGRDLASTSVRRVGDVSANDSLWRLTDRDDPVLRIENNTPDEHDVTGFAGYVLE